MIDSWCAFDNSIKLSENALKGNKVENYSNLKKLVHQNFFNFDKDFRNYKAVTIENAANSERIFHDSSA